jgi:hypothetical protein
MNGAAARPSTPIRRPLDLCLVRSTAAAHATVARQRRRPPLRPTSRDSVDVERPSRAAITENVSRARNLREISSRSSADKRSVDVDVDVGRNPPAVFRNVAIVA